MDEVKMIVDELNDYCDSMETCANCPLKDYDYCWENYCAFEEMSFDKLNALYNVMKYNVEEEDDEYNFDFEDEDEEETVILVFKYKVHYFNEITESFMKCSGIVTAKNSVDACDKLKQHYIITPEDDFDKISLELIGYGGDDVIEINYKEI